MRQWLAVLPFIALISMAVSARTQDSVPADAAPQPQATDSANGDVRRDESNAKMNSMIWQKDANQNQAAPASGPHDENPNLTDAQRDAARDKWLGKFKERYDSATPDQQAQMRETLRKDMKERYDKATPQEQAEMREHMQQWKQKNGESEAGKDGAEPVSP